ncbi:thioredoxin-related transmembrane protein 2 homolog [Cylas formicarius]|uniref:thioredoxin-related transmembrane protein 2 homolog n=1 Tax=Cylas formicarius TaxID=197179 RepID=UPI002958BDED|nr:thioredoxin-related transmembrane protein 2 homolog [Cylas formicarius]
MSFKADALQLLKPYYLVNIILSLSYITLKRTPGICNYLFNSDTCEFDGRETEILFFLLIVVMIRTRKSGSVTMISYLSSSFIYIKLANLILWFNADYLMGIIYGIVFILGALLVPEPTYSGPTNVLYFRGEQSLTEEIAKDKTIWLVAFYTAWNPVCVNFAPVFSKLSMDYSLDNLKFGKIDIGRYLEAGKKYRVSDSSMSQQLPTVILFENGKEVIRRPTFDSKGKLTKFIFSEENMKVAFGLNNFYEKAKRDLKDGNTNKKSN